MSQTAVAPPAGGMQEDQRTLVVSSDGHAVAPMDDYKPYMTPALREDFDAFCEVYREKGVRVTDPASLRNRVDEYLVEDWIENVFEPGRHLGQGNADRRIEQLDREGIAAEILFPDFGLPWELHPPLVAAMIGYKRTREQIEAANQAHNRWLADFCASKPGRFGGLALVSFADVDATVQEIRWAKEHGLVGIVLPTLPDETPFFHPRHEPIWDVLEELEMPCNTHTAISSVSTYLPTGALKSLPHPALAGPIMTPPTFFFTQQILSHLIWGGVFERHPNLQIALTEQGSGWVVTAMCGLDYSYEKSYLRRDVREIVKHKPSEYYARQVHMGSSLFSEAEARARYDIGVDKITVGMDYPHHEGTWGVGPGTTEYLRATLGAAGVPADEARLMLGTNAIRLWHLDEEVLTDVASRIGAPIADVLAVPTDDHFPRGDVHKPLASAW